MKFSSLFLFLSLVIPSAYAQQDGPMTITGIVLREDSLTPFPDVHVINKNSLVGTVSAGNGRFSITAFMSDTIILTAVGYMRVEVTGFHPPLIIVMQNDTIMLKPFIVNERQEWEKFRNEFLALEKPKFDTTKINLTGVTTYTGPDDSKIPIITSNNGGMGIPLENIYKLVSRDEWRKRIINRHSKTIEKAANKREE